MPDIDILFNELRTEFTGIPSEHRYNHLKQRLKAIEDKAERKQIEDIVLFVLESGMLAENTKPILIAMIHGIRTQGEWHDRLKTFLEHDTSITVKPIKFGFIDCISFWLPVFTLFRHLKVKHITKEMRLLKRDHPNHEVVVIAHSFGTFLISKFLKKNTDYNIDRLLLCGSIVPESFDWNALPNFPKQGNAINDIGCKDIWPVLAKTSTFGYGASGRFGFNTHTIENRYHNFSHSDFFSDSMFKTYWQPFIKNGEIVQSPFSSERKSPDFIVSLLGLFPGFLLIIALSTASYLFVSF
ncbi:MAG: hypothetical protein ABJK64_06780 [Paraglaciecola sp.]|uniref:hypothetical protein n=1 Tax=Paraglaciecola sp. TaxID=1920173 RepID=UPI003299C319